MSGNGGYSEQALYDEASSNPQTQLGGVLAGGQAVNVAGSGLNVAQLMGELDLTQSAGQPDRCSDGVGRVI